MSEEKNDQLVTFKIGQIIKTKKPHVCGCNEWQITRIGAEMKLQCVKCQRIIIMDRQKVRKLYQQAKK